ncbi:TIGR02221 family CRISPR-associated protein [Rhodothermus profundi]|uniref:CRISPR-associated protein, TM1812 family n=1 Tax=Rhodothermus profundi TaxID=633813 RepID=A0A1M6SM81_9BACT|nr:TIGR02221 family CRISPR-associated protein [Rhodothermus profundi]SHK45861.1 CRISPR-associated protein, TM1812 family [Rhodothermus profundi]
MKETLFLLLGSGDRYRTDAQARNYRRTVYFMANRPEKTVETPFVGEAILKLHPRRFRKVFILGTVDAMWDTLFLHATPAPTDGDDELYCKLYEYIEQRDEEAVRNLLPQVQHRVEAFLEHPCSLHLIPVGRSHEELWQTFRALTELSIPEGLLSLDITHGLRYQPFFLLLAMFFLSITRPGIRLGSLFYGAHELRGYFADRAPIFDLSPLLELMQWSLAARTFAENQEISELLRLMKNQINPGLAQELRDYAYQLQFNLLSDVRHRSRRLSQRLAHLEQQAEALPLPFRMILPTLRYTPDQLANARSDWEAMLQIARSHLRHDRLGLAVLAAYEAVVSRLGEIYQVDPSSRVANKGGLRNQQRLVDALLHPSVKKQLLPDLHDLVACVRSLRQLRNRIAHARTGKNEPPLRPEELRDQLSAVLAVLEQHLGDPALKRLPQIRPL